MEAREYIINKLEEAANKQKLGRMVSVILFWKDPFGAFNERVAYFEDFTFAYVYAEELEDKYKKFDFPFLLYFNTGVRSWNKETELTSLVIKK